MILITGASGFIGRHLLRELQKRQPSNSIRSLIHSQEASDGSLADGQMWYGDLRSSSFVAEVVRGTDVIVHLAAMARPNSQELAELRQVNVECTRNLYSAATAAGCRYFLHVSSAGVYGPAFREARFREDDVPKPVTPYQTTKFEAEKALQKIASNRCTLNILRPAGVYGPGSYLEIPTYKRIQAQRFSLELAGDIVVHPTHVRDVVAALIALIERPAAHGTVFNLGGERPIAVQELYALVAKTLRIKRHRFILPSKIAGPLSTVAAQVYSALGRPRPLLAQMSRGFFFSVAVDDRHFRKEYPAVPVMSLTEGVCEHLAWARAERLI